MLSKSNQRKLSLFLTCLVMALASWLFFALSNKYVYTVDTNVNFRNFPENKAFHPLQSDTVTLQIQGTGWQLLFDRIRINPRSVKVDLRKLGTHNYITFTEQLRLINSQFNSEQKVIAVEPDTLYFDFSARSVKRIPVKLIHKLGFIKQYGISGPISVSPSYVMVTGPKEELSKIIFWPTDSLRVINISSGISKKVSLRQSRQPNISIYPLVVNVTIPVDEFTERSVEVPVRLLNQGSKRVKLLPSKVKVTYLSSLGNYQYSGKEGFKINANLEKWTKEGVKQLPVHLVKIPPFSKVIRVEPESLDFMVKNE